MSDCIWLASKGPLKCLVIVKKIHAVHGQFLRPPQHCADFKNFIWDPKHGRRSRGRVWGRSATTFIDQLENDNGLSRQDLASVMANKLEWDRLIKSVLVRPK